MVTSISAPSALRTVSTAVTARKPAPSAAARREVDEFCAPAAARPTNIWSSDDAAVAAVNPKRAFSTLSPHQRALFGAAGERAFRALSTEQRAVFLLITERLSAQGVDLQGMLLLNPEKSIRPNRLLFSPDSPGMGRFAAQLAEGRDAGRFTPDKVFPLFHPGMSSTGYRENRRMFSMQVGLGEKGAFVDVDRYSPFTDWKAWLGHFGEIVTPGKPAADDIARAIAG